MDGSLSLHVCYCVRARVQTSPLISTKIELFLFVVLSETSYPCWLTLSGTVMLSGVFRKRSALLEKHSDVGVPNNQTILSSLLPIMLLDLVFYHL